MHRIVCLAVLLLSLSGLGSLRGFIYGSEPTCVYDNWVSHVSEGKVSGLNVYAPWEVQNNDFGDYHIPTEEELRCWGMVVDDFLALELVCAQQKIRQFGFSYQVVDFQDLDSSRNLFILREILNGDIDNNGTTDSTDDEIGSFDYGWGLYLYNPDSNRPIVITVPHPCDDYPAPVFAMEAFYKLDARFLMIAGAGREVAFDPPYHNNNQSISDPSRCAEHPFNEFYQRAGHQIRGITGKTEFSLQIHTYDWHKYQNKPNVMLSAGSGGSDKCSSLLVLLHLTEGGTLPQYSTRRFSILPQNFVYQQHPGFSLLSFPQAGFGATVSEFLGNSASAWILGNYATWQPQTSLNPTRVS